MEGGMPECPPLIGHDLIVDAVQSVIDWLTLMKHFPREKSELR